SPGESDSRTLVAELHEGDLAKATHYREKFHRLSFPARASICAGWHSNYQSYGKTGDCRKTDFVACGVGCHKHLRGKQQRLPEERPAALPSHAEIIGVFERKRRGGTDGGCGGGGGVTVFGCHADYKRKFPQAEACGN